MLNLPGLLGAAALTMILTTQTYAQDVTSETVLATVGDQKITLGHVIVLTETLPDEYKNLEDEILFGGVLDQLIQQAALAQSMEGTSTIIELKLENERRSLQAGAALQMAMISAITDETLAAAYEEQYAGFEPSKEYNASHILVETEEEAAALVSELSGDADFADLAKEHSTGPSGPNGGELGWFGDGMMVQPFQDAVSEMEDGGISAPVQTQFGWHVIKLNESRLLDVPTLEMVRGELAQKLQDTAVEAAIEELTEAANVVRNDLTGIDPTQIRNLSLVEN